MDDLPLTYAALAHHLAQEAQCEPELSHSALRMHWHRRAHLRARLDQLAVALHTLESQWYALPTLPNEQIVLWAEAVLCLPNLVFLELETVGDGVTLDIVRVTLTDGAGHGRFDTLVRPLRHLGMVTPLLGHLSHEQLASAPPLADVWETVREQVVGHYVQTFDWSLVSRCLQENAAYAQLPALALVGDGCVNQATRYFHTGSNTPLATLCRLLGQPLATDASTVERLVGVRTIVEAMATGMAPWWTTQGDEDAAPEDEEEEDAHPLSKAQRHEEEEEGEDA